MASLLFYVPQESKRENGKSGQKKGGKRAEKQENAKNSEIMLDFAALKRYTFNRQSERLAFLCLQKSIYTV
jgi:hypothetical protein